MTDFEMLSIVLGIVVGFFTVQFQTASVCNKQFDYKHNETKKSYPSDQEK